MAMIIMGLGAISVAVVIFQFYSYFSSTHK